MSSETSLESKVKAVARLLGFDLAGIASAEPPTTAAFLREWLDRGYAGEMAYLERGAAARLDPSLLLPGARSALVLGLVYRMPRENEAHETHLAEVAGEEEAAGPPRGRIARYAAGEDYHPLIEDRLASLALAIEALAERPVASRAYVDTGPVLERALAQAAGLGWIGKNTCLIDPGLGSYLFLSVLLLDLPLSADTPLADHCGTCTACLDACPTAAFPEPYVLDARRCIAYTTIESREDIPVSLREAQGDWVFGCDICQEVCPWNRRAGSKGPLLHDPLGLRERLSPVEGDPRALRPTLAWLLSLDEDAWRAATRGRALRRARYRGLLRNALVAAGNSRDESLRGLVERHAGGDDPMLAEHARWALDRLSPASAP